MQGTKFNLVTDLQIMLFNVTHSNFYFECNTERGSIDQLYIELGFWDLEKTVLDEFCVSGTVLWSPTNANSPTYTYISHKS